ncbi:modified peptide precursor CbpA [Dechloromonas sp. ARDL1]|jgi:modified peptide precursor CbpA|uniref:modified peptide precursor CbpA n=1 Tax=Dechloromonas sp. ARDL1 TaxID=3322121 RepID=UPI003DA70F81
MSQIVSQVAPGTIETQASATLQAQPAIPTIAIRKRCNPDGIGLSHYVLMDRKAAK